MIRKMDRSTHILAILTVSLLLAMSVEAMLRRYREYPGRDDSSSSEELPSARLQSGSSRRTAPRVPESVQGTLTDDLSRLNMDTRPRISSRFATRKSRIGASEKNHRFPMESNRAKSVASTSASTSNSGRVRRTARDILPVQKLDLRKIADVSSEEDTIPSRTENTHSRSLEREFKSAHGTDGTWEYARRMQRENRLNAFCTSVQLINGDGFSLVNDAHLTLSILNLGSEIINADTVRFTTAKRPHYTYYITKGLRADCVFTLTKKLRTGVFTLGKHLCHVEGPSPLRTRPKERTLHQGHLTTRALSSSLRNLFGSLNENNVNNV